MDIIDQDAVALSELLVIGLFDFAFQVVQDSLAVFDFEYRILNPFPVTLQCFCKAGADPVGLYVIQDKKHADPFRFYSRGRHSWAVPV